MPEIGATQSTNPATGSNHGCGLAWCTNDMSSCDRQLMEHFTGGRTVCATADAYVGGIAEVTVGGCQSADTEPAPHIWITVQGEDDAGSTAELQLNEAIVLHAALGALIEALCPPSMVPARVLEGVE